MDSPVAYHLLQKRLGHRFSDVTLLAEALRHSSFVNEQKDPGLRDNERLEFLGDAVLNLAIGHLLMQSHPAMQEGDLSRIRANMVNESHLADIARNLSLGEDLQLGKGEIQTLGREKSSILANALEAVIAAIYLDGGFERSLDVITDLFADAIRTAMTITLNADFKSRLQEAVQSKTGEVPQYQVVEQSGPDHDKTFHVRVTITDIQCHGTGKSKKLAEQDAAHNALEILESRTCHRNPN